MMKYQQILKWLQRDFLLIKCLFMLTLIKLLVYQVKNFMWRWKLSHDLKGKKTKQKVF